MTDILDEWFPRTTEGYFQEDQAPTQEKKVSNKKYGQRGEKWTRDYMLSLAGIHLEKRSDAPVEYPGGVSYPATNQLDHFGYGKPPYYPTAIHFEVEVKTFEDSFTIATISEKQVEKLTEATDAGAIGMLSLVERVGLDIVRMFWIPWPQKDKDGKFLTYNEWFVYKPMGGSPINLHEPWTIGARTFAWVMSELRKRVSGNFKGKSIRPQDLDLLEEFSVYKEKNRWTMHPEHWLRYLFDIHEEQPKLL